MHQRNYARKINALQKFSDLESFRSFRHRLALLRHTRPDIMAPVNMLLQVTSKTFTAKHISLVNGAVKRVKEDEGRGIMHHALELERIKMVV